MPQRASALKTALLISAASFLLLLPTPTPSARAEEPQPTPRRKSSSVAPSAKSTWADVPLPKAVHMGLKWLVLAQCKDGGWNTNGDLSGRTRAPRPRSRGGATTRISASESDVGSTAFAALALMDAGNTPSTGTFQGPLHRAVDFVLKEVEAAKQSGLQITDRTGTQIQSKIGRYADTFLAARMLVRADGQMRDAKENGRVRKALKKVLAKIEAGQQEDGSWNVAGWAPIHSTAYGSLALWEAKQRGHEVNDEVLEKVERFTIRQVKASMRPLPKPKARSARTRRGKKPVITPSGGPVMTPAAIGSAGVVLYSISQGYEQLTRTPQMRKRNIRQVRAIEERVNNEAILKGLGSMGGEEFISYANINLAMARIGGDSAEAWNAGMKERLANLQNADGSWSGHHCITGRTPVTGLAVSTMLAERSVPRRD